jgi:hypothetical protein
MRRIDLFDEYHIANEYYQAAMHTYGTDSDYERNFRYKLLKIKRKIRRIDRNFRFDPTTEVINIDYSLFGQNIEELLCRDFDLLSRQEFNFVSHHCSGGMFNLYKANEMELKKYKDHYLLLFNSDYISLRRIAVINDLMNS